MLTSVIRTFFGYSVRPQLYPELARKVYKNIFDRKSATKGKKESKIWCANRAIDQQTAILKLTGAEYSIYKDFPKELEEAKRIEKNCPVKMGGGGALELIYALCEYTQAENVLETGVAYGWSSMAILLSLQKREGILYSSDMPYLDRNNDRFVGCIVPDPVRKYWKLFRQADKESLPKIFKQQNSFKVAHYDSDKSYKGRMWAYPLIWRKIQKNGFFISDDIGDNSAFKDWVAQNKLDSIVIEFEGKYVGVVKKQ
ncbi:MAG: class I SAM-dependent methyltransferase [Flavobacteriaceae bacterium]|jgi:hypothetical protein|nr:class I SAM-dependent methyltransferase [Flavobacteriaceae bacterium]